LTLNKSEEINVIFFFYQNKPVFSARKETVRDISLLNVFHNC